MEKQSFIDAAVQSDTDECILWPWGTTGAGYPSLSNALIHRVVCERAHGPSNGLCAAHSCGTKACINPRHIRWATYRENNVERRDHGRMPFGEGHGRAKLTDTQVLAILKDPRSLNTIARAYGVSKRAVLFIKQGVTWQHLTLSPSILA